MYVMKSTAFDISEDFRLEKKELGLYLTGSFTGPNALRFKTCLDQDLGEEVQTVEIDLHNVTDFDLAALNTIMKVYWDCKRSKRKLRLKGMSQPIIQKTWSLAGIDHKLLNLA